MTKYPIEKVLPHVHPMILVNELVDYSDSTGSCLVNISPTSVFYDEKRDAVPACIGIEYLAQTIAAHASANKLDAGNTVKVGFLVSTKNYKASVSHFSNGDELVTHVSRIFKEPNGLGAFECSIKRGEQLLIEATINVFEPEDATKFVTE